MDNLTNINVIKGILEKHGFSFSKGLGQNFLINPDICPRIAEMGNAPSWKYSEEDYFNSMGYRDGYLYVDGARVDDIINFEEQNCYICIDVDGNAIARESWNGKEFIKDEQFDEKLAEIKKNSKGMFLTVLDIHD